MPTITRESMELLLEEILYAVRTTENEILQYEKVKEILRDNGIVEVSEEEQRRMFEWKVIKILNYNS